MLGVLEIVTTTLIIRGSTHQAGTKHGLLYNFIYLPDIFNVLGKFISKEKGCYQIQFAANRLISHCNIWFQKFSSL